MPDARSLFFSSCFLVAAREYRGFPSSLSIPAATWSFSFDLARLPVLHAIAFRLGGRWRRKQRLKSLLKASVAFPIVRGGDLAEIRAKNRGRAAKHCSPVRHEALKLNMQLVGQSHTAMTGSI
jgi:hypothetical protein